MNLKKLFEYKPPKNYNFNLKPSILETSSSDISNSSILDNLELNLRYIKSKYNSDINSDVVIREFSLIAKEKEYKAFLLYIDGMVETNLINNFVLTPLMIPVENNNFSVLNKNSSPSKKIFVKSTKNFNLEDYIYSHLIPQNAIKKMGKFEKIIEGVNSGNCALFVDSINIAFDIDVKGFKQRSISSPNNEVIINGSQEAFVENLRTNTSILRRLINNENLCIENTSVGNITKTSIAICYMKNIANDNLVKEVKFRLNNIEIDSLLSTGELEQLIEDNERPEIPTFIQTERPDKCSKYLMQGRVIIIVNGNPYALIVPAILIDFLSSPEDSNIKVGFSNFLKGLRIIAFFITLLAPGIFIAITSFHEELLPTELLFSILASRENVPFPIIVELLLMELSFELIRESGLRVPAPIGGTLGIVGALILGDAAVNAHIVSPILIIVVAITGLSSFAIPDFSFSFHLRICRFLFVFLGYIAGLFGIGIGLFLYLDIICGIKSFGVSFTSNIFNAPNSRWEHYFIKPTWKKEIRETFLLPKKSYAQNTISKKWKFEK